MKLRSRGMTLIELVVVVAILAVLAMIVLPKLDGVQSNANHAVGATSASDTAKYIQTYRTMKQRFPDGWDSLTDGTGLVAAANPANANSSGTTPWGKGLHAQLVGSTGKLALHTLTAEEAAALSAVGITTLYNWTAPTSYSQRPGDRFLTSTTVSSSSTVAIVNAASTSGQNIINRVYRGNLKSGGTPNVVPPSGTTPRQLMAVGLGPLNNLVGGMMLEAPQYPNVDTSLVYSRNLALFEIGGTVRPVFKGVVAADGDLLDDLTTYMNRDL